MVSLAKEESGEYKVQRTIPGVTRIADAHRREFVLELQFSMPPLMEGGSILAERMMGIEKKGRDAIFKWLGRQYLILFWMVAIFEPVEIYVVMTEAPNNGYTRVANPGSDVTVELVVFIITVMYWADEAGTSWGLFGSNTSTSAKKDRAPKETKITDRQFGRKFHM